MPHPKGGYRLADNTRVPGVTTILGRFKDSGALIHWAYKQGREHENLASQGKEGPSRLYETVETAAAIGTVAHEMVEAHINGNNPEEVPNLATLTESSRTQAIGAFKAYRSWEGQSKLKIIDQEMSLVSEALRFGGTPDAVGQIDNELVLVDWKTSNSVYPEMLCQLAAYGYLLKECRGQEVQGFHLCRFAKLHGDFAHHYYPNLDEAWTAFKLMRELYELDKGLKKRAA